MSDFLYAITMYVSPHSRRWWRDMLLCSILLKILRVQDCPTIWPLWYGNALMFPNVPVAAVRSSRRNPTHAVIVTRGKVEERDMKAGKTKGRVRSGKCSYRFSRPPPAQSHLGPGATSCTCIPRKTMPYSLGEDRMLVNKTIHHPNAYIHIYSKWRRQ